MNPLQVRLAALRRRLHLVVTFRGASWVAAILLLAVAVGGLIDWRIHLPDLVRALILSGTLSGAGYVAYRYLLRPLLAKADDLSLALRVEERYPVLNDALASAVQFLEKPAEIDQGSSPGMRKEAVQRALGLAKGFNFNPVVDTRGVRAAGLSLVAAGSLAVVLGLLYPQLAHTALLRLAHPFGGYDWPRQTQLEIKARDRVARGEAFEFQALVRGVIPDRAIVEYRFEGAPSVREIYEVTHAEGAETGKLTSRLEAGRVQRKFRFQVLANDAASAWFHVEVLPPPQLAALGGRPSPQVHLQYPAYTDLPEQDLPDGASSIEAIAGTLVTLRAAVDRPIARAWLEYPADLEPALGVVGTLNALGMTPLAGAADLAGAHSGMYKRIPARLSGDGRAFGLDFIARVSGTFSLRFEDELGIGNVRLVELRTLLDPAPIVHLERPSRSQDSLDVLPDAEITLHVLAADPVFALRTVYLEYRLPTAPVGSAAGTGATVGRLMLYDNETVAEAVPSLLSSLSASGVPVAAPPLRLRTPILDISRRWSLKDLKLKEGDVLTLQACADDFDDVTLLKKPGRSQEVELRVVSKNVLDIALNEAQAQIQQELIRLQKQQQEALEKVIPAETHWRTNKGLLQPKHLDELLQAEQLQQQIRARVGTRQEGLRAEVARVQQALRDNHMPRTGTQDRMETIANELDRLAREELEQIEPRLTEARKESEAGADKRSGEQKDKAPLPEARKHQEEVKKTLDELLKLLEPWSSTREVKGEAKSILQDQRELQKQTDALREPPQNSDKFDPDQMKAEQIKTAELQNKLAERTGELLGKLRRLADARSKDDPEAKAMKEAADKGEKSNAAGKMQDAQQSIRDGQFNKAATQQAESAKAMEEVVKAMEDRREEDLDRLIKKMKEAEKKLADLEDRQDLLQKKMKDVAKITDPAKREEELKRLAREQEQLQKETQEMVRELSRLRADRASQALSQAGSQMQRASRQMDSGQEAEDQQDEALDRLNDAQKELQQSREEAEEELAREKLAKVADLIKGLRERQESLTAESVRIHSQVLQRENWTRELLGSLDDLAINQKSLGEETNGIATDKLASAKVFTHLLIKSAEAMRSASVRIKDRYEQARNRSAEFPQKDKPSLDRLAENMADEETRGLQRTAIRRIDQLLDALKPDKGMSMRASNQGQGGGGGGGGQQGGSKGEGDNIPPISQLKALKSVEQEIYDRTKDFNKKHPDATKLTAKEQEELKSLRREQQEIRDLFQEITTPADAPEGGQNDKPGK